MFVYTIQPVVSCKRGLTMSTKKRIKTSRQNDCYVVALVDQLVVVVVGAKRLDDVDVTTRRGDV